MSQPFYIFTEKLNMKCDGCGLVADYEDLTPARDLSMRLTVGGLYSDVECPECGALCFPVKGEATSPSAKKKSGDHPDLKLRMHVEVEYHTHGVTTQWLRERLVSMVERSIGDGGLTGKSVAEVENWSTKTETTVYSR